MRRDCFNIAELFKSHCCLSQEILALGPTPSLKRERKDDFSHPFLLQLPNLRLSLHRSD